MKKRGDNKTPGVRELGEIADIAIRRSRDGQKEKTIAPDLNVSQSYVSRALKRAEESVIVRTLIDLWFAGELEQKLLTRSQHLKHGCA